MSQYDQPGNMENWWGNQGAYQQQGYAGPPPTRHWWPKLAENAFCGEQIMVRVDGAFKGSTGMRATTELDHVDCVKCLRALARQALDGKAAPDGT